MKTVCVIPARLKSTRFPRKMLALLKGIPLLERVWTQASRVSLFDDVLFAIDSEETGRLIDSFGGKWKMTSEECPSGTHRLIELLKSGKVEGDLFVNWQGDEPFICESMIVDLLQSSAHDKSDVWTLKKRIVKEEELHNPHIAKVVCDARGFALYFSRSQIPYYRDIADFSQKIVYKHVGLYAYTRQALEEIDTLPLSPLEHAEQLEMLRFLSHGLKIRVHETDREVMGIDLPEHLAQAESYL